MHDHPRDRLARLLSKTRALSLIKRSLDRETVARYRSVERHILAALANTRIQIAVPSMFDDQENPQ